MSLDSISQNDFVSTIQTTNPQPQQISIGELIQTHAFFVIALLLLSSANLAVTLAHKSQRTNIHASPPRTSRIPTPRRSSDRQHRIRRPRWAMGGEQARAWLGPERMNWFKSFYLPDEEDWTKWDASPIFAPVELLAKAPNAWIGVGELDILRDDGVQYGEKLKSV
ncbi:hypothetical protein BT96DRAFT_1012157 [Gymnopus androsaceus JB14]|uniref:Alpha/beta hydrolase fold-3 domain-containing protein n=1 Tax=Gymnopus androsaceus JB14 TaxID=1447944 RepID=A0A6A4IGM9_9AGAR|nr:hypothetical protein BT96DRAFT_1012157 [Gymnopus androsaceus JB14]